MQKNTPRAARRARALLALLTLVLACVSGQRAPDVAPSGTLSLREGEGDDAESGPLRVVFSSPRGELRGPSEITVLFSKPMRALELAGNEAPFPGKIEPAIPGVWQWTGTRAVSFIPAREDGKGGASRLPGGTSFRVTIPASTRSLAGETLAEDYVFSFSTERPRLVSTQPWENFSRLKPDDPIFVFFNQPVADAEIEKNVKLLVGGAPVPFKITRPDPANKKHFQLAPARPLPLDAALAVSVGEGLRSEEGPLPSGKTSEVRMKTYGPLVVEDVSCETYGTPNKKCSPSDSIQVALSNPVKFGDLKRALTIEPAVKLRYPSYYENDTMVESVSIWAPFAPASKYTVRVRGPLVDDFKQPLKATFSRGLEFDDHDADAQIGMNDGVFEAKGARKSPVVAAINTRELSIVGARLREEDLVAFLNQEGGTSFASIGKIAGAITVPSPEQPRNRVQRRTVPLDEILGGKDKKGAFVVGLRYMTTEGSFTERTSVAQLTDLAVTAKVSKAGSLFWVTRLSDAKPVASAKIRIRRPDQPVVSATTDANGFATVSATDFQPRFDDEKAILFVESGDDLVYQHLSDNLDRTSFAPYEQGLGLVFTDRGIYRPGDRVKLKGIVREETWNGTRTPALGKVVKVAVRGPNDERVNDVSLPLSSFGTFNTEVVVPPGGRLGTYGITVDLGGDLSISSYFTVNEYRPAEFSARVESDKPSYLRGEGATWTLGGDYLFGAPMGGAKYNVYVSRSDTHFTPDGYDEYTTGDDAYHADLPDSGLREGVVFNGDGVLDARGSARATVRLDLPGQQGPEAVTASVDVTDVSRQMIGSSTTAIVHPAAHYVGMKLASTFVEAGKALKPQLVTMTPEGKAVTGKSIVLSLLRRKWVTTQKKNGDGALSTVSSVVDTPVSDCRLTSQAAPVGCDLTPLEGGYYVLRAASVDDAKNNVFSSIGVYATGNAGGGFSDSDDRQGLELIADRDSYRVGEKARILVKSPLKQADALVTIERGGIYDRRTVKLSGPTPTIEVPITEEMRPNAFVSVIVLGGRSKVAPARSTDPDVGQPTYRMGEVQIQIDASDKALDVGVTPSKTALGPGEELGVDLLVKDAKGAPTRAEVTLYAVDEGVLSLIDYETPNPLDTFAATRNLKVATFETRAHLARLFDPLSGVADKGLAGGGGDSGPGNVRKDFSASAYFNPSIVTDAEGKAKVRFKLPDSLTTYRLMAVVASADDRFGYAEKHVTTSRPLMVRPALPRFARAGDRFQASAIVTSKGLAESDVDVTFTPGGLKLTGDRAARVRLKSGESKEVRFPVTANAVGTGTFRFDASGGGGKDAAIVSRPVRVPMAPEAVALYGETTSASAEKLGDLSQIRDDVGELKVTLSSSALVGLEGAAEQVLEYPYGCTEQLTSKLVPLVVLGAFARDFGFAMPANTADVVQKTASKIVSRQRGDGGFGFWDDSTEPNLWVTAYAAWGLHHARKAGASVDEDVLNGAIEFMRRRIESPQNPSERAAQPFVLGVLGELGAPDPGRLTRLFEERESLPMFARASLLHAMAVAKADRASIDTLTREVESSVRLDGPVARVTENLGTAYAEILDSSTRTTALVLRGLLAANPKHPMASRLVKGLLSVRDGGAFRNTQEAAWSLVALADYRAAQENVVPSFDAHVFLGQDELGTRSFKGRSLGVETLGLTAKEVIARAGSPLAFDVEGEGKLFYEARLKYVKKTLPTNVVDRGFFVEKRYRVVTPDVLEEALATVPERTMTDFTGGNLVLVDVVVVTPKPRTFVVVDDPLPAGFEAVDTSLATTNANYDVDRRRGYDGDDEDGGGRWSHFTRELRDDRVLFFVDHMGAGVYRYRYLARATTLGEFVLPPTRAEEMYAPEVFGRNGTSKIVVR